MADQRLPELVAVATPVSTDLFGCRQAADTRDKKCTRLQLHTLESGEKLIAKAGTDLVLKLGDAAGANKLSITDSADVEVFNIDSTGKLLIGSGENIIAQVSNKITLHAGSSAKVRIDDGVLGLVSGYSIGWANSVSDPSAGKDVSLHREAAAILALRGLTVAQTYRIYTTFTDASNYERLALTGSAITVETAGTGADNIDLNLTPAGTGLVILAADARLDGGVNYNVTEVDATTYTLLLTDNTIAVDHTATAAVTLTLPSAALAFLNGTGKRYLIKDSGANAAANNITINRAGADTIVNGATGLTSVVISANGDALWFQAKDASTWIVF